MTPPAPLPKANPNNALCSVDHLVYTCSILEDGIQAVERLTGVRATVGGRHPGLGTHNALLALSDDSYFEIIAPDLTQPTPNQPRPFRLDEEETHNSIVAFAVHPVAAAAHSASSIENLALVMAEGGEDPGPIAAMSRQTPDGGELRWRLTSLSRAAGPRPCDWGALPSPAKASPAGCSLVGLTCYGPDAVRMGKLLHDAMGLQPLAPSGQHVNFAPHETSHLVAELDTPKGRIRLGLVER